MKKEKSETKEVVSATRMDFLKTKARLTVEEPFIESLGKTVRVAKMNVFLSDIYEESLLKITKNEKGDPVITAEVTRLRTKLVAATLVDDDNKPMFSIEEIGEFDPEVIAEIYKHAERLNGKGEAQEEMEKNSSAIQTDGSSSD